MSGLNRHPAKVLGVKASQEFESLTHRHTNKNHEVNLCQKMKFNLNQSLKSLAVQTEFFEVKQPEKDAKKSKRPNRYILTKKKKKHVNAFWLNDEWKSFTDKR